MSLSRHFNLLRIYHLIKRDLILNRRIVALLSLIIFLSIIIASFSSMIGGYRGGFNSSFFAFLLFSIGIIISAKAFNEMHDSKHQHFWHSLPASNLEKVISKWLLTAVIWPLSLVIIFSITSLIAELINMGAYGFRHNYFNPINYSIWKSIVNYILIQSIFFYGSAHFKRHPFIKIVLSALLFLFTFIILTSILVKITTGSCPAKNFSFYMWPHKEYGRFYFNDTGAKQVLHIIKYILKYFYFIVMMPMFTVLSYFKVKNYEAMNPTGKI